jgi:hypothetical protein
MSVWLLYSLISLGMAAAQMAADVRPLHEILGYALGDRLTDDPTLQRFLEELVRSSPRARLVRYGSTHEGRPLQYLIVTSERNHARLDSIRGGLVRLTDPRKTPAEEAERLASELPVAIWLAYSVHGNEHSGTEAAISVAYELSTSEAPELESLLEQAVVLIDPCQNPDGRSRFVFNFRTTLGRTPSADPAAREHDTSWGSPRYNHYYFDLNRDWFILSQPESLGRAEAFRHWPGQVYGDFHEMGSSSTYFFYPPTSPLHAAFGEVTRALWDSFGDALAAAFDRERLPYYTAEYFDAFYPGYGDTWPTLQGAIGMTFEQASARGLMMRRDDETILRYADAIRGHVLASKTTIRHSVDRRKELLLHTWRVHQEGLSASIPSLPRQIFILPQVDPLQLRILLRTLQAQGVEFDRVTERLTLKEAYSPLDGKRRSAEVPSGSIRIATVQPKRRLLQALFEKEAALPQAFVSEERRKLLREESSGFYDITAWSLPLSTGVPMLYTDEAVPSKTEPAVMDAPAGDAQLGSNPFALLLPWSGRTPGALFALLEARVPIRVGTKAFRHEGRDYAAGTLVALAQRIEGVDRILTSLPAAVRAQLIATQSGRTESGPDLGSDSFVRLSEPKIALVSDRPTDEASFGALAYLFDRRYEIPFTAVRMGDLGVVDLTRYNVLILPDGNSGRYKRELEPLKEPISAWVQGGGVLVGIRGGAAALADEALGLTDVRLVPAEAAEGKDGLEKPEPTPQAQKPEARPTPAVPGAAADPGPPPPGLLQRPRWPIETPGAILLAEVDPQHHLGYGLPAELPVLYNTARALKAEPQRLDPVRLASEPARLHLSGHLWPEAADTLKGAPYVVDVPLGQGHVVLFIEDPSFRTLFWQLERLLLNAVLLSPSF